MKKALIIGSLNMDMSVRVKKLPKLGETVFSNELKYSCGGKGANQALASSKIGLATNFLGVVGNDDDGKKLILNLEENNIKTSVIIKKESITGKAIIMVDENGNNNIVVVPGANYDFSLNDIDNNLEIIKNSDILIMQNEIPLEVTKKALKIGKEFNKITLFNVAPAVKLPKEIYEYVDYLIVNETEFEYIFEVDVNLEDKIIEKKKEFGISNLIITLGEKGSIVVNKDDRLLKFGIYKVKAIDSTAAGDSFIGAFASKIVNGENLEAAIRYASAVSAIVVTKKGAQESIPNNEEINNFILKNEMI